MSDGPRYQVRPATEHRCCYEADVFDADRTDQWGDNPRICACHDTETAELIALALNQYRMGQS